MAQAMLVSRRFRSAPRILLVAFFVISCFWLWLYFNSLCQRRKAESLFTDLRAFSFASADFAEVRDFALSHGGTAIQGFPPSFPTFGLPLHDSQGQVQIPRVWSKPECTSRECVFEIWIRPSALTVTLSNPLEMRLLTAMTYAGIRPWGVYARFEIVDGKLERSRTSVGGMKSGKSGGYDGLIPLEYEVVSDARPVYSDKIYSVGRPHVTGGPMEILRVQLVHIAGIPTARVFDVNLKCLTALLRGCSFSELAPSVWSDYQYELTPNQQK